MKKGVDMLHAARMAFVGVLSAIALGAAGGAGAVTVNVATNQIESSGTGDIFVRFDSMSAAHSSDIVAIDFGSMPLFNNQSDAIGTTVNIGSYAAGEAIEFRLDNLTKAFSFFTGLALDNPDGVQHANLVANPDGSITVFFEDLWKGGDRDYNDFVFSVYETPIPAAGFLLLSGLAGLGFASRKKNRA